MTDIRDPLEKAVDKASRLTVNRRMRERIADLEDDLARLRDQLAWHVADKNKWQDVQAGHLREITAMIARVAIAAMLEAWPSLQERVTTSAALARMAG